MHRVLCVLRRTQLSLGQCQHPAPVGGIYILKEPPLLRIPDGLRVKEHLFTSPPFCTIAQLRCLRHHSI